MIKIGKVKIDENATKEEEEFVVALGKRDIWLLIAFFAGILFITGTYSAFASFLSTTLEKQLRLVGGISGVILIVIGLYVLYYASERIR